MGDHDDRRVELLELGLEPLERVDVEVVRRLVEQQQVGLGGERAGQRRARELAAGERLRAGGRSRVVGEAEVVQDARRAVAPRVAAAVLELAPAGARSGRSSAASVAPPAIWSSIARRSSSIAMRSFDAGDDVVAQRDVALARRALVVQRDARALLEDDLAAVDRRLARRASAAASSCPRRCARRWSAGRGARA